VSRITCAGFAYTHTRCGSKVARSSGATRRVSYSPGANLSMAGLGARARLLRLGVHALAKRAHVVDGERLVEADRGDAEGADVILARERDHPAVAARHVDDLAGHAELLEIARGTARAVGDRLAGLEHPDRDGKVCGRM
jgi:hypothetical protein